MLKIVIVALALVLAGTAGAAEWRSLRVDASSDAAFEQSLAVFKDQLSPEHRQAFGEALTDIWIAGTQTAEAERRKYRAADYYRQIDGLSYEEIVRFATGETAKLRLQAAAAPRRAAPPAYVLPVRVALSRRRAAARSTRSSRASSRLPFSR